MTQIVKQNAKVDAKARRPEIKVDSNKASLDYQPGFGNQFVTEAVAGRFARRPQFAATAAVRALC